MTIFVGAHDRTQSYPTALAGAGVTDCYTNSEVQATKGVSVHIGNESGGAIVALIYWYDATAATSYCLHGESIGDDQGFLYDLSALRLDVGDKIQVGGGAANVDVVVTVTPFHGPG